MAFKWAYSLDGSDPIMQSFVVANDAVLSAGELVMLSSGEVTTATAGSTALVGAALALRTGDLRAGAFLAQADRIPEDSMRLVAAICKRYLSAEEMDRHADQLAGLVRRTPAGELVRWLGILPPSPALMAALGSEHTSLKGDADEGHVELTIDGETYERQLHRTGAGVSTEGEPYLDGDDVEPGMLAAALDSSALQLGVLIGGRHSHIGCGLHTHAPREGFRLSRKVLLLGRTQVKSQTLGITRSRPS